MDRANVMRVFYYPAGSRPHDYTSFRIFDEENESIFCMDIWPDGHARGWYEPKNRLQPIAYADSPMWVEM